MSKRNEIFRNEIIPKWEEIGKSIQSIDVKGLPTNERDEIAHLKKIFAFLSKTFNVIDADFIPLKTLQKLHNPLTSTQNSLVNYLTNGNINYILNINNDYVDTILNDLMPFVYIKGTQAKSLQIALEEYSKTIIEHSNNFLENAKNSAEESKRIEKDITEIAENLSRINNRFQAFEQNLFESEDNTRNKIDNLVIDFDDKYRELLSLHDEIFSNNGVKASITNFNNEIEETKTKVDALSENIQSNLDDLNQFHQKVFGSNEEDGLQKEIFKQQQRLDTLKQDKEIELNELKEKIESLLPNATSAGLASAYLEKRESFSKDIEKYNILFYIALFTWFLIVVGITLYYSYYSSDVNLLNSNMQGNVEISKSAMQSNIEIPKSANQSNFALIKTRDIWSVVEWFMLRLPFLIPILWFTIFVSKRRSEAQRLEQEYAHKEVLAKSYESYRNQIEKLDEDDRNKLLPILLDNMIKAIALNPAETLDKSASKDKTPLEELINKKDEFFDLVKKLKEIAPNDEKPKS